MSNPLLARVKLPGESFTLPSRGLFYTNGEISPDIKDGAVHVHAMTAIDEFTMRSPDKILSGDAVEEVFARCIPSILKPRDLLVKDVDFLMGCLRKVSYGSEIIMSYNHECSPEAKKHKYTLSLTDMLRNSIQLDPATTMSKFTVELENGQVCKMHPLKYRNVVSIMQNMIGSNEDILKVQTPEKALEAIADLIERVDDIEDRDLIIEWLSVIPVAWAKKVSEVIEASDHWGPAYTSTVTCKDCGQPVDLTIPLNPITFFT